MTTTFLGSGFIDSFIESKKPLIVDKNPLIEKGVDHLAINYLIAIANEMFKTEHSTLQGGDRYG
jgi:hypothetical protein